MLKPACKILVPGIKRRLGVEIRIDQTKRVEKRQNGWHWLWEAAEIQVGERELKDTDRFGFIKQLRLPSDVVSLHLS